MSVDDEIAALQRISSFHNPPTASHRWFVEDDLVKVKDVFLINHLNCKDRIMIVVGFQEHHSPKVRRVVVCRHWGDQEQYFAEYEDGSCALELVSPAR